ncbi:MAG: PQQ-binding-like beta-propeller repeat protein [Planctomycetota bacterium]
MTLARAVAFASIVCGASHAHQLDDTRTGPGNERLVSWSRFHFALDNSGFNPHERRLSPVNVARLVPVWTFDAVWAYGSPVVTRGRVFVGTGKGYFYVLDELTGSALDVFDVGQNSYRCGVASAAAIDGDLLFVQGAQGALIAYDYVLGRVVWWAAPPEADVAGLSSPAVFDGKVYHGISNGNEYSRCNVGRIQCYDEYSGALVWNTDMVPPGYTGGGVWSSVAVDATRRLVIAGADNPNNGSLHCSGLPCDLPGDYTDSIVALDADTGAVVWSFQILACDSQELGFGYSSVVLFNDGTRDLAGAGSKTGWFHAVDRNTGQLAWSVDLGYGGIWSSAAFAYGKLFLNPGTANPGVAVALDARDGSLVWSQPSANRVYGGPAVANGLVFTGLGRSIAALDQRTGRVLWSYDMGSPIYSNPAVVNGCLYVVSRYGLIRKFALRED